MRILRPREDQETNFQTNAYTAGPAVDQESFVRVMFFTDAFLGMVFPYFLRTYLSKHNWSALRDFVNWMKSHFGYEAQNGGAERSGGALPHDLWREVVETASGRLFKPQLSARKKQLEKHPFRDQFFQAQKDHLASHEEMGSFEEVLKEKARGKQLEQIDAVNAFVNCLLEEEEEASNSQERFYGSGKLYTDYEDHPFFGNSI
ncbi:hypothetical protein HRG_012718 [Hirsutella rhossiliensis]